MALLQLTDALAVRENVVRLSFNEAPYYSRWLDPGDAFDTDHFDINGVAGTVGLEGELVRPVGVQEVDQVLDSSQLVIPTQLDVVLDRGMTRYPAQYTIVLSTLKSTLGDLLDGSFSAFTFYGVGAAFIEPADTKVVLSRDFANAQTIAGLAGTGAQQVSANLGKYIVDASGDYASDQGLQQLKKRIFRRLVTRKGSFVHLPGYGVGLLDMIKKLASSSVRARLATETESQIKREPGVAKAKVKLEDIAPGVIRLVILVRSADLRDARFAWDLQFGGV